MPRMRSLRVLLVDDDAWTEHVVQSVLGKRGHSIQLAQNAADALIAAPLYVPDVVICDPAPGGLQLQPSLASFLSDVRARDTLSDSAILILSALSSSDGQLRSLPADGYLAKPFRFADLDRAVDRAVQRRRGQAADTVASTPALTGIHGTLDQLSLASLLTMIEMERKSGILVVQRGAETGRLVCQAGRVLAAELLAPSGPRGGGPNRCERGVEVIYRMLAWHSGRFDFTSGEVHADDEIGTQITHLLMEGARRLDEAGAEAEAAAAAAAERL